MGLFNLFQESIHKDWLIIDQLEDLDEIQDKSNIKPQLIFKHSTRCSISTVAKTRMETALPELQKHADVYYLDLLAHRTLSNAIAEKYNVEHESPQALIIKNGTAVYHVSHQMIQSADLLLHL